MTEQNIYQRDLEKNPANYQALTPISFLGRAARVYPDYPALIHGPLRQSWAQTERRQGHEPVDISAKAGAEAISSSERMSL